jgi:hypothetical protein
MAALAHCLATLLFVAQCFNTVVESIGGRGSRLAFSTLEMRELQRNTGSRSYKAQSAAAGNYSQLRRSSFQPWIL